MDWRKIALIIAVSVILTLLILMVFRTKVVLASGVVTFPAVGYTPNAPTETPTCDCNTYAAGTQGDSGCTPGPDQSATISVKIPRVSSKDVTVVLSLINFDGAPTAGLSSLSGDPGPQWLYSTRYVLSSEIVGDRLNITLTTRCSGVIYGAQVSYSVISNSI